MERVVSTIAVKVRRKSVRVLGYSKTDRGVRFVSGSFEFDSQGLSQVEVNEKVTEAITKLLEPQAQVR